MASSSPPMLHGTPLRPSRRPRSGKDGEGRQAARLHVPGPHPLLGQGSRSREPHDQRRSGDGCGKTSVPQAALPDHPSGNRQFHEKRGRSTPAPDPGNHRNAA